MRWTIGQVLVVLAGVAAFVSGCGQSSDQATFAIGLTSSDTSVVANAASIITKRLHAANDRSTVRIENGGQRIRVFVADSSRKNLVLRLLTEVGQLEFRAVTSTSGPPCHPATNPTPDQAVELAQRPAGADEICYHLGPALLSGQVISAAAASEDKVNQAWRIDLTFTSDAAPKFDALAAQVIGRPLAVVVDGRVLSAPIIQASQFNGRAQITGAFTMDEAEALAAALAIPPLPVMVSTVKCSGAACGSSSS